MYRLRLEQILSNLSYNSGSNILTASGSVNIIQTNPSSPALQTSGSLYIVDSPNVASASLNTSGSININILDGGSY